MIKMNTHLRQERNQAIGLQMQEYVAVELERFFPEPEYKIVSYSTNGADIVIYKNNIKLFECEVKTAIELFLHNSKRGNGKIEHNIRRGMFSVKPIQLDADFWAFVIRFTDTNLFWNGDIEIWYALGKDVKNYLESCPLNCINWKFCIENLPSVRPKEDFLDILDDLKKLKEE